MSTRAPSFGRGCRAQRGGVGFLFWRRSGAFVNGVLETIFFALFHTARTLSGSLRSPPSPRGEGFVHRYSFLHVSCIRFDDRGIAVFSFRCLPTCRESCVILVPSSTTSIALTRASQRGAGSILRLFDCHAFSGGNPLHLFSNVLPHRRRGQDRPARGIPLCGCSL